MPAVLALIVALCWPWQLLAATTLSVADEARARQQIGIIIAEKDSRRLHERKIGSSLLLAIKEQRGIKHPELKALTSGVRPDASGNVLVDIKADVSADLLQHIDRLGGRVIHAAHEYKAIRAELSPAAVEALAWRDDVSAIRRGDRPYLRKTTTSQGVTAHSVPQARLQSGASGQGVKVGVLSDSVDYLQQVQASGDLPQVTILQNAPGNSGEGTAMLEIVHDIAPSAQLYFATAWLGTASFAQNILALKNAGCSVIVDDVGYFNQSPFQDDIVAQTVNTVAASGVLYFSAAGNNGNLEFSTASVWEGNYRGVSSGIASIAGNSQSVHAFSGNIASNPITSETDYVTLFWSDPLDKSANDYDLYVVSASGSVVWSSTDLQTGFQDPYESIYATIPANQYRIVVAKYSGQDRFIHVNAQGGKLGYATSGQIYGQPAAEGCIAVAAVKADNRAFSGSERVEPFSSDGPRRVFYTAQGNALTPGNLLASGGALRNKPDIAAADGVSTSTPGFATFFGTSAAAPHAAGIAALLKEVDPSLNRTRFMELMAKGSLDIHAAGWDNLSGQGLIMADKSLSSSSTHSYLIPYFRAGQQYWTGLALSNMGASTAQITVTAFSTNAVNMGTQNYQIPPNGQDARLIADTATSVGWIQILSTQPLQGLSFIGDTSARLMYDVPVVSEPALSLHIPHIAQNPQWDTDLFVANPGSTTATVTIQAISSSGTVVASTSRTLPALSSQEIRLSAMNITNLVSGRLEISSTQPIGAFSRFSNLKSGGLSVAGINAVKR